MLDILITNATIVTVNPAREILYGAALAIQDGRIVELAIPPRLAPNTRT